MMTNLFSIFDPSTSTFMSSNWVSSLVFIVLFPLPFWALNNRLAFIMINTTDFVTKEMKLLLQKAKDALLIIIALFIFIILNNLQGLLPYTFTATSHMSITFMMALPLWLATMLYGWGNNTSNMLIHMVPNGTPVVLMPFMVIIETISTLIKPITLSVRLAANMVAGHLLISLLTGVTSSTPFVALPLLNSAQLALESLEIAVAMIQAYVFSVLITLYVSESI